MSLLFIDGFDHYATADIGKKWSATLACTISATSGRRGGGCLNQSSNSSILYKVLPVSPSTLIVGFAFQRTASSASTVGVVSLWDSTGVQHLTVAITTGNLLTIFRGTSSGTLLATGSTVISATTWYYIELKANIHDTTGSYTLKINGVTEFTASGVDTRNAGVADIQRVNIGHNNSSGYGGLFDDLYICDTSSSVNNDFLGDVRVDTLLPNADGTYTDLVPNSGSAHWSRVSDTTPDTTSYVTSATVGAKDTYQFGNLPVVTGTVMGVQVNNAVMKDDSGVRTVANTIRSATTDADGATVALATSQTYVTSVHETDPATAAAWTEAGVNAAEFGIKVVA